MLPMLELALAVSAALAPSAPAPLQDSGLEELSDSLDYMRRRTPVVRVVEGARPAVVYIETDTVVQRRDLFGRLYKKSYGGSGSGVVIMKEGFIVTNFHVVKNAQRITVQFDEAFDERVYEAELVSYVEEEDLALLSIQGEHDFPTVPLGTSSDLMTGEPVVAIGNPYGQTHTVSTGIISGLHRDVEVANGLKFEDLIQTDASINFGNSGGPLININGKLIGINSAMNTQAENIGFAIPVDRVRQVLEDQLLSPEASRAWLGFSVVPDGPPVRPGDAGPARARLRVDHVFAGGPAEDAGLARNSHILSINGKPVSSYDEYRLARLQIAPGAPVEIEVEQGGKRRQLDLLTWDKTDGILYEKLGLAAENVRVADLRYPLVRVKWVFPESPAASLGLQPGDWIESVSPLSGPYEQAWRIVSRDALAKLASELSQGTHVALDVFRDLDRNGRYEKRELHRGEIIVR